MHFLSLKNALLPAAVVSAVVLIQGCATIDKQGADASASAGGLHTGRDKKTGNRHAGRQGSPGQRLYQPI